MRFGIVAPATPAVIAQCETAEALGFDVTWLFDSHMQQLNIDPDRDYARFYEHYALKLPNEHLELLDEELIRALAIVGTPGECLSRVRALAGSHGLRLESWRKRTRTHAAFFARRDRTMGGPAHRDRRTGSIGKSAPLSRGA